MSNENKNPEAELEAVIGNVDTDYARAEIFTTDGKTFTAMVKSHNLPWAGLKPTAILDIAKTHKDDFLRAAVKAVKMLDDDDAKKAAIAVMKARKARQAEKQAESKAKASPTKSSLEDEAEAVING